MAPPRVSKAFRAMRDIGISEDKTKPVLKKLLKLYDKNWELIEEENYRVLADAIFDEEDSKVVEEKKCQNSQVEDFGEDVQGPDEPERPLKRLRLRGQETQVDGMALKKPKLEEDAFPETSSQQQMQLSGPKRSETGPSSSRRVDKGKEPVSPRVVTRVKKSSLEKSSASVRIKEPGAESGVKNSIVRASGSLALLKPKDEPITDDAFTNELPIAAIHPDSSRKEDHSIANDSVRKADGQVAQVSYPSDGSNKGDGTETSSCKRITGSELATVMEELHPNLEIASSPLGEVFFTSEGKGWGLRTLEDLPKGSFVCEYAGEILTISEMYHRKVQSTKNGEHTDPVLLDGFWNKEGPLKEEKALCLDATNFGNVARFINHRCFDANLVDIAVEIETPDHHNYHLALFTTRKIDAMEELTWDYGIDFDDLDHHVKPFLCQCGSKFCRNMKRSSRSKSASSTR